MARRLRASTEAAPPAPLPHRVRQRPDIEVWLRARRLAHGDVRRLRVLNECTVLVLNNPA